MRLALIARKDWGLTHKELRILYTCLFGPIATYAAPAWSDRINKTSAHVILQAQKYAPIRVMKAYNTTSTDALPVIAGQLPVHLKIQEMVYRYKVRKDILFIIQEYQYPRDAVMSALINKWQHEGQETSKGRHTFQIFPDIEYRLRSKWIYTNHHVTQFLSGHGDFAAKLKQFKLTEQSLCSCGRNDETPQHILFTSTLYEDERSQLHRNVMQLGLQWSTTL